MVEIMSDTTANNGITELDGENETGRGIPSVNQKKGNASTRGFIMLAIFILLIIGFAAYLLKNYKSGSSEEKQKIVKMRNTLPSRAFEAPEEELPVNTKPFFPEPQPELPVNIVDTPPPLPIEVAPKADLNKSASSLMVVSNTSQTPTTVSKTPNVSGGNENENLEPDSEPNNKLSNALIGTTTKATFAGHLGNRNLKIAKGSFIDCALLTKIDSSVPGMISCVVTRNIFSDNGKVLLIERGSTVVGEHRADVELGKKVIFVLWTRIKTPNGVLINVDSPGTDELGGSGVSGWVDNHFAERFGAAIMLSLIHDASRMGVQLLRRNNNNLNLSRTGTSGSRLASRMLRYTANIKPTLYKNQGGRVGIFLARDLDFSGVYDVAIAD